MGFISSLKSGFNTVKRYVSNPTTWLTGGSNISFDYFDKGLSKGGLDLFGSGQQKMNNQIAQENNQLQRDAYEFNKNLSTDTFDINKDIAYNGSQIKSADMAKAGLNPLAGINQSPTSVSSTNVQSPELSQPGMVEQTGLQKLQTVANIAMGAKQLQSSIASAKVANDAAKAQTRYQQLVNDYFDKYKVLPSQQNEWIAQLVPFLEQYGDTIKGLPDGFVSALENRRSQKLQAKVDKIVSKNEAKLHENYNKGKADSFYNKNTINSAKYEVSKYPANEKGFIDWRNSRQGQEMIQLYGYSSAREFFFSDNFRRYE